MKKKKIDQSIRSDGAENFVRAFLMIEYGIITYGASRNMPGYDLIACDHKHKNICKISVKYRSAADADGFHFSKQNDYQFAVAIVGNKGSVGNYQIGTTIENTNLPESFKAQVFVFPKNFVLQNLNKRRVLSNPLKPKTPKKFLRYENNWYRIIKYISKK